MNIANWTRIENAVNHSGQPDLAKGFTGWQKQAQITRFAILEARKEIEEEKRGLSDIYSEKETARRSEALEATYRGIVKLGTEKLEKGLEAVVDAKRAQFKKIALTAPTDEQLRLLQSMAMRDDLTDGEIAAVAADMAGNLQALKALGSIARKAGHDFPQTVTAEDMENDLDTAERFSRDMLASLEAKPESLTYNQTCFWNYIGKGLPNATYNKLDSVLYAAAQLQPRESVAEGEPVKEKPGTAKPEKPATIVHVTDGVDNLTWLATKYDTKVKDIVTENPAADLESIGTTERLPADLTLTITPGANYTGASD